MSSVSSTQYIELALGVGLFCYFLMLSMPSFQHWPCAHKEIFLFWYLDILRSFPNAFQLQRGLENGNLNVGELLRLLMNQFVTMCLTRCNEHIV